MTKTPKENTPSLPTNFPKRPIEPYSNMNKAPATTINDANPAPSCTALSPVLQNEILKVLDISVDDPKAKTCLQGCVNFLAAVRNDLERGCVMKPLPRDLRRGVGEPRIFSHLPAETTEDKFRCERETWKETAKGLEGMGDRIQDQVMEDETRNLWKMASKEKEKKISAARLRTDLKKHLQADLIEELREEITEEIKGQVGEEMQTATKRLRVDYEGAMKMAMGGKLDGAFADVHRTKIEIPKMKLKMQALQAEILALKIAAAGSDRDRSHKATAAEVTTTIKRLFKNAVEEFAMKTKSLEEEIKRLRDAAAKSEQQEAKVLTVKTARNAPGPEESKSQQAKSMASDEARRPPHNKPQYEHPTLPFKCKPGDLPYRRAFLSDEEIDFLKAIRDGGSSKAELAALAEKVKIPSTPILARALDSAKQDHVRNEETLAAKDAAIFSRFDFETTPALSAHTSSYPSNVNTAKYDIDGREIGNMLKQSTKSVKQCSRRGLWKEKAEDDDVLDLTEW